MALGSRDSREHMQTICCGPVNRGVALYNGRVYEGLLDGTVVAVDQETGKPVWRTRVTNDSDLILTAAVRVVKGKVIVGSSGAETGSPRLRQPPMTPRPASKSGDSASSPAIPPRAFENRAMAAKTWTGEWWKLGGGGEPWDAFAYDPETNTILIGTGNGYPWNRRSAARGGGDNLFSVLDGRGRRRDRRI